MINLLGYRRGRGKPKQSWNKVIKDDLSIIGMTEDMAQDRSLWRSRIKVTEHRQRASSLAFGFCVL